MHGSTRPLPLEPPCNRVLLFLLLTTFWCHLCRKHGSARPAHHVYRCDHSVAMVMQVQGRPWPSKSSHCQATTRAGFLFFSLPSGFLFFLSLCQHFHDFWIDFLERIFRDSSLMQETVIWKGPDQRLLGHQCQLRLSSGACFIFRCQD